MTILVVGASIGMGAVSIKSEDIYLDIQYLTSFHYIIMFCVCSMPIMYYMYTVFTKNK